MPKPGCCGLLLAAVLATMPAQADPFSFVVDVSLSKKAATLLRERKERIVVAAIYEGFPVAAKVNMAGDEGMIGLGTEEIELAGSAGRAQVTGRKLIRARLSWVKTLMVLINVYSARRSSPDNLLACDVFEDTLAKAQRRPIAIFCTTLDEAFGPL